MKLFISILALLLTTFAAPAIATHGDHYVFTMTNAETDNEVLMYLRNRASGQLGFLGAFPTGGVGGNAQSNPGDPLGSMGSIELSPDSRCLFAVNAGSNTISTFSVRGDTLIQRRSYYTNGNFPVSVAINDDLVYVLNAGDDGSISGFHLVNTGNCLLKNIRGSTVSLNAGGATPPNFILSPSQIKFTPDNRFIVTVVKGLSAGVIWVFPLTAPTPTGASGFLLPGPGVTSISEGFTPFSFDFDSSGNILLTEAFGEASNPPALVGPTPDSGAVSSYKIEEDGTAVPISSSVGNSQTATCWIQYSDSCAFTTNNVGNTISSYAVDSQGGLSLMEGVAAKLDAPIDLSIVDDLLYVVTTRFSLPETDSEHGQPAIYTYEIDYSDCSLVLVGTEDEGLPAEDTTRFGVVGMVARAVDF